MADRHVTREFASLVRGAAALCLAVCAIACGPPRELQTITRSVELDQAESVAMNLEMGAGEMIVGGGADQLLEADFRFNVPSWEPVLDYRRDGERGVLDLRQPSASPSFGRTENRWTLRLNNAVPIDLTARMGASQATMTLGQLNLRSLQVHQGVGELILDLRGTPTHSYTVQVNGGVGSAHIRVPTSVGIVATAAAGIGSIDIAGLEKHGDEWDNPWHEDDSVTIYLEVNGGIGEIRISAEEGSSSSAAITR